MTLRPCPFCGSEACVPRSVDTSRGEGVQVFCEVCEAEGPIAYAGHLQRDIKPKHWAAAKKRWNERATPGPKEPRT